LTNDMHDSKRLAADLDATRQSGIDILPPCVNRSMAHFTVEHGKIRFGLAAIKGVGHSAINAIVEAREAAGGAFDDIFHLVRDLDLRSVGRKTLEALAMTGALDHFEGTRAQQAEAVETAWAYAQKHQADKAAGQNSLFGGGSEASESFTPSLPNVDPWAKGLTLRNERDLMGFYVSGHPLDDFAPEVRAFATMRLGDAGNIPHESNQTACGIITDVTRRTTKQGKPMAFITIEDTTGSAECVLFSQAIDKCGQHLELDEVVLVRGKAETSGELKLIANDVLPMWKVREQMVKSIILRLDADTTETSSIDALAALCENNKGHTKLYFDVESSELPRPVRLHARTAVVEPTPELMKGLGKLFGREAVVLEGEG
ncbi:MAG: OB-fold nucleic acid binding domain-containing protein, partial [Rubricoccaceae bacterium]|nr:OB-fold nucleic acid binding domain-containing protein [Rubricoccaceae bacterium]